MLRWLTAGAVSYTHLDVYKRQALAPADGPWFFFVAVNPETGETKFAVTQAEHDALVLEFQTCLLYTSRCV